MSGKDRPRSRPRSDPDPDTDRDADTDAAEELAPSVPLTSMPISLGVLVLGLTVSCLLCLLLSGAAYRNASAHAQQASRASERRLARELLQLKAAATELQAQLDHRAQDSGDQAREIERLSAELKAVRARTGLDGRGGRARRPDGR